MRKSIHRPEHDVLIALIRELRLKQGLTQVQVCAALEMPQSFMSDVERGQRRLDLVQLHDLCRALRIPLKTLVDTFEHRVRRIQSKRES